MTGHNRRKGYWQYYEKANESEQSHMKETLIDLIREIPCPREKKDDRGRPPVHSKQKLDFACLMMMADNNTYRGIKSDLQDVQTPWSNEPIPDHTWLVRHMQTIPEDWLDLILAETARRCIKGAGGRLARWVPTAVLRRPRGTQKSRDRMQTSVILSKNPKESTGNTT